MSYSRTYSRINWEDYSSTNTPINAANLNKMDYTLEQLDIAMAEGGGGGTGTSDYSQLSNKPKINNVTLSGNKTTADLGIVIPSKTSDLTNDSGFLTTETDPTVPAWAKELTKPSYTASEVGALPDTTVIPTIEYSQYTLAGTHIADIKINGTTTEIYAPTSGGGGGGVSTYAELPDKPSINNVTLSGNKSLSDLGIASASDIPTELADLGTDATHRVVTDTEKETWNAKASQSSVDELAEIVGNANALLEEV